MARNITVTNPFTGQPVTRNADIYTRDALLLCASRMSDEENYMCETDGSEAEWVVHMVAVLGAERAGEILLA